MTFSHHVGVLIACAIAAGYALTVFPVGWLYWQMSRVMANDRWFIPGALLWRVGVFAVLLGVSARRHPTLQGLLGVIAVACAIELAVIAALASEKHALSKGLKRRRETIDARKKVQVLPAQELAKLEREVGIGGGS